MDFLPLWSTSYTKNGLMIKRIEYWMKIIADYDLIK